MYRVSGGMIEVNIDATWRMSGSYLKFSPPRLPGASGALVATTRTQNLRSQCASSTILYSQSNTKVPEEASLSPVILVTSGNKEAVVGGFISIVIVPLWVVPVQDWSLTTSALKRPRYRRCYGYC